MRKKLLLVEDNTELLDLLRLRFKQERFLVRTATNGLDALKKARAFAPDLILLDMMLPELDGFAVCEILRNDPATAPIPVVALTGLNGALSRFAGLESGATDFITKPFSTDALIARVKTLLRRSSPRKRRARKTAPAAK